MSMMMMMMLTAVKPVSILLTLTLGAFPSIGGSRIFRGRGDFGNLSKRSERAFRGSGFAGE